MNLTSLHSVYFIGIGGIGMSALARFFNEHKVRVSGYDRTETPLTLQLSNEGIDIHYEDDLNLLDKEAQLVIYTPAIPAQHLQLNWYRDNKFNVVKRSDVLQMISQQMESVCVAGTHGKTTVSTMIAHLLRDTQIGCNAFLGGISSNYGVNYWSSAEQRAVIEADEYDRSFLKLFPEIAVVTAMDPDHLDIYGTSQEMERCYLQFISQVRKTLIYKFGLKHSKEFIVNKMYSYSIQNDAADYYASDILMKNGTYTFNFCFNNSIICTINLNTGGMHNVENAVAALAVCHSMGIDMNLVANAMNKYNGVKRRFDYVVKNENLVYIDDYAHHPEELKSLITSAKALFRNKKITVVFQPHLFTRTRDFADDFAQSLDLADEVFVMPIYPARELPIDGVNSTMLLEKMAIPNKQILTHNEILEWANVARPEVLITAGAGDIDKLVNPLKDILSNK